MKINLSRADTSVLGNWWWTIDRSLLLLIIMLMGVGMFMTLAASPAVAERLGLDGYYFIYRHSVFLGIGFVLIMSLSFIPMQVIKRVSAIVFALSVLLVLYVFMDAEVIKGSRRWIRIFGINLQPSEMIKPSLVILVGWYLSRMRKEQGYPGWLVVSGISAFVIVLLVLQPDFGMSVIIFATTVFQCLIAGMSIYLFWGAVFLLCGGIYAAYLFDPHISDRINGFFEGGYQIEKSMQAFKKGGLVGKGPGEGVVKEYLPDAHTDFIFAVAGEEFGFFFCLLIIALFVFIVFRGFARLKNEKNLFVFIASSGLLAQFGMQAFVNMGSTLGLIPPKGMTLPFISYGGSSMVSSAMAMGMLLALTRKRVENEE
ncbi:MAG: cell division protein FtsW [Alphaproteobacteria bacterium]|nr:cell division protein FtsW [Alphaproteobacteria bacterium]